MGNPSKSLDKSVFTLFYSNVTTWGPQAQGYLDKERSDLQAVAEHHIPKQRLGSLASHQKTLSRLLLLLLLILLLLVKVLMLGLPSFLKRCLPSYLLISS